MRVTRKEIVAGVSAYVQRRFGGDWKAAFDAEDSDADGRLSTDEVTAIFSKAGLGFKLTRWALAFKVIQAMDIDGDGQISFEEFQKMTNV